MSHPGNRSDRRLATCGEARSSRSEKPQIPRAVSFRSVASCGDSATHSNASFSGVPVRVNSRSSAIGLTVFFPSRRRGQRTVTASTGATARHAWAFFRIASKLANDTSATMPRRNPSHRAPSTAGISDSHCSPNFVNNSCSRNRSGTCSGSQLGSRAPSTCTRMNSARSSRPLSCIQSAYTRRGMSSSMLAAM